VEAEALTCILLQLVQNKLTSITVETGWKFKFRQIFSQILKIGKNALLKLVCIVLLPQHVPREVTNQVLNLVIKDLVCLAQLMIKPVLGEVGI
jgi:hypothetical protein